MRRLLVYGAGATCVAVVLLFALNAVYGFFGSASASNGPVRTAAVTAGNVQSSVTASGNIGVATSVSANFATSGTVTSMSTKVGAKVKAGQVLARLDPATAQAALQAAKAGLAQAQSTLTTAKGGPTTAQQASNDAGLQQAQSQVTTAKQQLTIDESALAAAKTQLAKDQALNCPPAGTTSSSTGAATPSVTPTGTGATTGTATGTGTTAPATGSGRSSTGQTTNGVDQTTATTAATGPSAVTGTASNVAATAATLSGTVDPSGSDTHYQFQYGTSAGSLGSKASSLDAGSGNTAVNVTANLTGLKSGQTYYFRLVATNASGTVNGAEVSFKTLAAAKPVVALAAASNVLTTSVTLNGSVDPNGSDTHYKFEYGTTAKYAKQTPAVDLGTGTTAQSVAATVTGLKPGTAYLFRLVATNASGTTTGIGQVAMTAASSCVADRATITSAGQTVAQQKASVQTLEDTLTQTKATIDESATPSTATIAQDEAAVSQAEATVVADQKALNATILIAPTAGTVTAIDGSVGSTVTGTSTSVDRSGTSSSAASSSSAAGAAAGAAAGSSTSTSTAFVTIDSVDKLDVVASFAEADATKLAVGQPATITLPALPQTEVAGRVISVASAPTVVNNVVTYAVTVALTNPPTNVKQGMTANASVVNQTRSNVLLLPTAAITTTGPVSTVELQQNGKTVVTRVTTGLVGNSSTEIVSGLKKGDVVVLPTVTIATGGASTTTGPAGFGGAGGLGGAGLGGGAGFGAGGGGTGGRG
jgi:multidrug efflux pump subunit AcrA (membrane-fusion protein)